MERVFWKLRGKKSFPGFSSNIIQNGERSTETVRRDFLRNPRRRQGNAREKIKLASRNSESGRRTSEVSEGNRRVSDSTLLTLVMENWSSGTYTTEFERNKRWERRSDSPQKMLVDITGKIAREKDKREIVRDSETFIIKHDFAECEEENRKSKQKSVLRYPGLFRSKWWNSQKTKKTTHGSKNRTPEARERVSC